MVIFATIALYLGICVQGVVAVCKYNGTEFLVIGPVISPYIPDRVFSITACGEPNTVVTVENPSFSDMLATIGENGFVTFTLTYAEHAIQMQPIPYPTEKKSYLVTSTSPVGVFVYAEGADGYTAVAKNSEPSYITSSYKVAESCYSYFAIAAFRDNTALNIYLRINENFHEAQFPTREYIDGDRVDKTIQAHAVFFVYGMNDLTGTRIDADKPVSVFSGADCACIPVDEGCSGFIEQVPPSQDFGTNIFTFPIPSSAGLTYFRAIAFKWDTTFSIPGVVTEQLLGRTGHFVEWSKLPPTGDTYEASNHILPVQLYTGGSTSTGLWSLHTIFTPEIMFTTAHLIFAIDGYNTEVVMIIAATINNMYSVMMDGKKVDGLRVDDVHPAYKALVANVPPGVHTLWSEDERDTAVYVYEYGASSAYSFHGACWEFKPPVEPSSMQPSEKTRSTYTAMSESIPPEVSPAVTFSGAPTESTYILDASSRIFTATITTTHVATDTPSMSDNKPSVMNISSETVTMAYVVPSVTKNSSDSSSTTEAIPTVTGIPFDIRTTDALQSTTDALQSTTNAVQSTTDALQSAIGALQSTTGVPLESTKSENPSQGLLTSYRTSTDTLLTSSAQLKTCSCICNSIPDSAAVSSIVEQMKSRLSLDKHSLGLFTRKHISVKDDRPSAMGVGYTGVILIVLPAVILVLGDLKAIIMDIKGHIR